MDLSLLSNRGSKNLHTHLPVSVGKKKLFKLKIKKMKKKNGQKMVIFFNLILKTLPKTTSINNKTKRKSLTVQMKNFL